MASSATKTSRGSELQKRDFIALSPVKELQLAGYRETQGTHHIHERRKSKPENRIFPRVSGLILHSDCYDSMKLQQINCGSPVDSCVNLGKFVEI
jgi:hypothetical protein